MHDLTRFIFPKQIPRLSYLWRIVVTNAAIGATFAVNSSSDLRYAALAILAIFVYQVFFVVLPRLHDAGMSGWWVLVGFIPFVYVILTILLLFRSSELHFAEVSDAATSKA